MNFSLFQLELKEKNSLKHSPYMVAIQKINFGKDYTPRYIKNLQFETLSFPLKNVLLRREHM